MNAATRAAGARRFDLAHLPAALRPKVARWWERVLEDPATADGCRGIEQSRWIALSRCVAVSEFAARTLLRDPACLLQLAVSGAPESASPPPEEPGADEAATMRALRRWRQREMLRLLWRDLNGEASGEQTLRALSGLADAAIRAAAAHAVRQLEPTFGQARDAQGGAVEFIVLGMGKLGGRELNFSSDVDLIFLYSEGGETSGPRVLDNADYFKRLGNELIRLLDATTEDGFVCRVDMRLRPFGQSGPLAISLPALEEYLQQQGRDWERYAWIKARPITGPAAYASVFRDCVRPFVYRRYLDFGVFESLREMKAMIAREVARRDLDQHLKLGTGGIREIEFIAQSFQLVRGGSDPRLQNAGILDVLPLLAGTRFLGEQAVEELTEAYFVLRKAENAVQMIDDQQTHSIPAEEIDRLRLAVALGFGEWEPAAARIAAARKVVADHFESLVFGPPQAKRTSADAGAAWFSADAQSLGRELQVRGFEPAAAQSAAQALAAYHQSGSYRRLDEAGRRRIRQLIARLVERTVRHPHPDVPTARVLRVLEAIGSRSSYLALLIEQPAAFERLVEVCGISSFLSRQIAEFPLLLDELIDARLFHELPSREGFAAELAARMERVAADDPERQVESLRQFQKAAIFAVALADLTGRLPLMKVSDRLTDIAELILQCCMDLAWRQMGDAYGEPRCGEEAGALRTVRIAVAGYGKLGGLELGYGSDLDLVFLHDSAGEIQQTAGERPIENGVFFLRLGQRIVHLLTMHSTAGRLYEVDMRLRPNGKGGFLMTGIAAFERYQREEAWTWEHQALLRARAVAGDPALRGEFEAVRRRVLSEAVHHATLRTEVAQMRARMRSELSKAQRGQFDIKQDAGGIADIEFLVQYWVLAHAREHPELLDWPDNIRQLDSLAKTGILDQDTADWLAQTYREFRGVLHRLSLEGDGERVVDAAPFEASRQRIRQIWHDAFAE
ncbi:MAG: bifunctional [glutamate--ammonia ligase]-adenylyl-L-tyrosine phosphorylase/[glutamate--ammonia-ligase] adenylyltransferase [Steroidobacteraceae bacterium]